MSSVVELYVLQLKSLLPRKQRDDIAAEIRESIASAVEEREHALGRKLDDRETSEILKTYGHPIAVAGRYLPMQQLIGPSVFPLYWYVIQAVLVVIAAIGGSVAAIALFTEPRATQAAIQVLVRFFWIALDAGALVTVAFVLLDRRHVRFRFIDDFDSRKINAGIWGVRAAAVADCAPRYGVRDCDSRHPAGLVGRVARVSERVLRRRAALEPGDRGVLLSRARVVHRRSRSTGRRPCAAVSHATACCAAARAQRRLARVVRRGVSYRELVEIAANIRADDPALSCRWRSAASSIALFVLALVGAGRVATDLVRLFRR